VLLVAVDVQAYVHRRVEPVVQEREGEVLRRGVDLVEELLSEGHGKILVIPVGRICRLTRP
jgi:hypothetical protein